MDTLSQLASRLERASELEVLDALGRLGFSTRHPPGAVRREFRRRGIRMVRWPWDIVRNLPALRQLLTEAGLRPERGH